MIVVCTDRQQQLVLQMRHALRLGALLAPLHETPHARAESKQVGVVPIRRGATSRGLSSNYHASPSDFSRAMRRTLDPSYATHARHAPNFPHRWRLRTVAVACMGRGAPSLGCVSEWWGASKDVQLLVQPTRSEEHTSELQSP